MFCKYSAFALECQADSIKKCWILTVARRAAKAGWAKPNWRQAIKNSFKLFTRCLLLLHSGFLFSLFLRRHSSRSPLRSSFRQRNSHENIPRTEVAKSLNEFNVGKAQAAFPFTSALAGAGIVPFPVNTFNLTGAKCGALRNALAFNALRKRPF